MDAMVLSKSYRRGSRAGEGVRGRFDWSTDRRSLVIVDCTVGLLETILRGVPVRVGKRSRGVGMPGRARRIDKHEDCRLDAVLLAIDVVMAVGTSVP